MAASKRLNFDITPEQEAELARLRETLGASTTKDAVLRAVRVVEVLSRETSRGARLYLRTAEGEVERLIVPELESTEPAWTFLVLHPHSWRRQLSIKGRRLLASTVWRDILTNGLNEADAAENWDLPVACIREVVSYCETNRALLDMEAQEERRQLLAAGANLGPTPPG
jgi:hypothetical protein